MLTRNAAARLSGAGLAAARRHVCVAAAETVRGAVRTDPRSPPQRRREDSWRRRQQQQRRWRGRRGLSTVGSGGSAAADDLGRVDPTPAAAGADSDVLAAAFARARQLSELPTETASAAARAPAPLSAGPDDPPPATAAETMRDAVEAADALLALTSSASFARALGERMRSTPPPDPDVGCLHGAFLSIASWMCSLGDGDGGGARSGGGDVDVDVDGRDALVSRSIDLARRSWDLRLPLHAPLYADLASLAAALSSPSPSPLSSSPKPSSRSSDAPGPFDGDLPHMRVLSLGTLARESLHRHAPVDGRFFSRPLLRLVGRGMFREAVELVRGMRVEHGVQEVDASTGIRVLCTLADRIGRDVAGSPTSARGGGTPRERRGGVEEEVAGSSSSSSSSSSSPRRRDGGDPPPEPRSDRPASPGRLGIGTAPPPRDDASADMLELALLLRGPLMRQIDDAAVAAAAPRAEIMDLISRLAEEMDGGSDDDDDGEGAGDAIADLVDALGDEIGGGGDDEAAGGSGALPGATKLPALPEAVGGDDTTADAGGGLLPPLPGPDVLTEILPPAVGDLPPGPNRRGEGGGQRSPPKMIARVLSSDDGAGEMTVELFSGSSLSGVWKRQPHEERPADMVYMRDSTWELPDIVDDLVRCNMGRDVMYTEHYEEYIMEQMFQDGEDSDEDSDDSNGDGDFGVEFGPEEDD